MPLRGNSEFNIGIIYQLNLSVIEIFFALSKLEQSIVKINYERIRYFLGCSCNHQSFPQQICKMFVPNKEDKQCRKCSFPF